MDDVVGAVGDRSAGKVASAAMGLLDSAGGLEGVMSKLEASGLGDKVQSWIGTGGNEPVSAEEVRGALGDEEVGRIAREAGVSEDEAAGGLAKMLPEVIDRVSPDGRMPDAGKLGEMLGGLLGR